MIKLIDENSHIDFKKLYWFSPLDIEDYNDIFEIINTNQDNKQNNDIVKTVRDEEKVILFLYKHTKEHNDFINEIVKYHKSKYNIKRYETYILNDTDIEWFNSYFYKFEKKITLKSFIKVDENFIDVFMYELLI